MADLTYKGHVKDMPKVLHMEENSPISS